MDLPLYVYVDVKTERERNVVRQELLDEVVDVRDPRTRYENDVVGRENEILTQVSALQNALHIYRDDVRRRVQVSSNHENLGRASRDFEALRLHNRLQYRGTPDQRMFTRITHLAGDENSIATEGLEAQLIARLDDVLLAPLLSRDRRRGGRQRGRLRVHVTSGPA